jgi:transcriptional antiterminator RfaH
MTRWYVVQTQPRAEPRAFRNLYQQGFRAFLPHIRVPRRHARKTELALAPLFPCYLFVQFKLNATRWRAINGTRGIVALLANGSCPIPVNHGVVESLLAASDSEGVIPLPAITRFLCGAKVRITDGVFAGQGAEVVQGALRDGERVEVLLHLLGAQTTLEVPIYALEAA